MLEFHGFNTVQLERVGERVFMLGKHQTAKDIYAVWEKGETFRMTAYICDDERKAMAELQRRVDEAEAALKSRIAEIKERIAI